MKRILTTTACILALGAWAPAFAQTASGSSGSNGTSTMGGTAANGASGTSSMGGGTANGGTNGTDSMGSASTGTNGTGTPGSTVMVPGSKRIGNGATSSGMDTTGGTGGDTGSSSTGSSSGNGS